MFFERITKWVSEMRETGNVVEFYMEENAVHDAFFVCELTGFEDIAWNVAHEMAGFVKDL